MMREGHHMTINPRYQNGNLRRKYRERFKAMEAPCGICHGRLGRIHYEEPSDYKHPLSFVIDEIIPVSKYKSGGYSSRRECAEDWSNLQAAHRICNQLKSNRLNFTLKNVDVIHQKDELDGDW